MPTYDYLCEQCGHRFDAWQKITDEPMTVCPQCGGHVHRVIHPVGLVFKGGGFYSTDSRSHAAIPAAHESAEPQSASATEAKSETPADAKPAAAPAKSEGKGDAKTESKGDAKPNTSSAVAAAS